MRYQIEVFSTNPDHENTSFSFINQEKRNNVLGLVSDNFTKLKSDEIKEDYVRVSAYNESTDGPNRGVAAIAQADALRLFPLKEFDKIKAFIYKKLIET
ncbi:hypothetical protein ACQKM9_01560 [Viridibacillus sp. NPDC093762]|uniref:hypothetical protein n=1 Tax=Viridibacillus sp. NPDC093762 TaxID=3390720 RepID=UPI003CFF5FFB